MDVHKDFLPRVVETKNPNDKSFSYTGKGDFVKESPELVDINPRAQGGPTRTRKSLINSYT
jgi:hypothetical protein